MSPDRLLAQMINFLTCRAYQMLLAFVAPVCTWGAYPVYLKYQLYIIQPYLPRGRTTWFVILLLHQINYQDHKPFRRAGEIAIHLLEQS